MDLVQSIILGAVQGLTEFLPVSSSGHLVIAAKLLGLKPDIPFDISLHIATLIAVCAYFFRDIIDIAQAFITLKFKSPQFRLGLLIIIASIPTALMGFALSEKFEVMFGSVSYVGMFLILTGVLIMLAETYGKGRKKEEKIGFIDSIIVGIAQGCAIAPGLSRSGTTISISLLLGLDRETAARFSFLLSIPAILGATLFKVRSIVHEVDINMLTGMLFAAITGYAAIWFFVRYIKKGSIRGFAYYCFVTGILAILFLR